MGNFKGGKRCLINAEDGKYSDYEWLHCGWKGDVNYWGHVWAPQVKSLGSVEKGEKPPMDPAEYPTLIESAKSSNPAREKIGKVDEEEQIERGRIDLDGFQMLVKVERFRQRNDPADDTTSVAIISSACLG